MRRTEEIDRRVERLLGAEAAAWREAERWRDRAVEAERAAGIYWRALVRINDAESGVWGSIANDAMRETGWRAWWSTTAGGTRRQLGARGRQEEDRDGADGGGGMSRDRGDDAPGSREIVLGYQAPVYVHVDVARRKVTRVVCIDEAVELCRDERGRPVTLANDATEEQIAEAVEIAEDPDTDWPEWTFGY